MTPNMALMPRNGYGFDAETVNLIKEQVARGASDAELSLFLYTASRTGLDPLARQIYCIKRWDSSLSKEVMSVQVSIDGYRLIADRTGRYAPGRAPTFEYDNAGRLVSATAYVMKYVRGTWHEVAATAYYEEYVQRKRDGAPMALWASKPRVMLSKVAEALALRRAFPAELSGVYTSDEMGDEPRPLPVTSRPTLGRADAVTGEVVDAPALPEPSEGDKPSGPARLTDPQTGLPALGEGRPTPPPTPTKPGDLLAVINGRVEVPYDNVPHLWQALRNEYNDQKWQWPQPRDLDGWRDAYARAYAHAQRKSAPATPTAAVPDYEGDGQQTEAAF